MCRATGVHGGWGRVRWRARQLALHFSTFRGMPYGTGAVRLGGGLRASLTPALVLHVRTWRSAALAWEQPSSAPLCSFQPSAGTAPEGGLWRGGAALGSGQGETRAAGLLCHGAGTPEGGKDSMGDSGCPLQGHPLWPGNSSRMGSLHGAPSSAGLAGCGLGQILKTQAFQRVGKTPVRQFSVCKGWCETSLFILSS